MLSIIELLSQFGFNRFVINRSLIHSIVLLIVFRLNVITADIAVVFILINMLFNFNFTKTSINSFNQININICLIYNLLTDIAIQSNSRCICWLWVGICGICSFGWNNCELVCMQYNWLYCIILSINNIITLCLIAFEPKGRIVVADPEEACSAIAAPPERNGSSLKWFVLIKRYPCQFQQKVLIIMSVINLVIRNRNQH